MRLLTTLTLLLLYTGSSFAQDVIYYDNTIMVESAPAQQAQEKIYDHIEQMPQFPGGETELLKWVAANVKYPQVCQENDIQGRVVVQFVVKKDGSIGPVKVVRPKDPDLDREAIRVIKSLPLFTPGRQNGVPVNVWYTLPITFRLQRDEPSESVYVPEEEILNPQAVTELEIVPPDKVTTPPSLVEEEVYYADNYAIDMVDQYGGTDNILEARTHETRAQVEIPKPEPANPDTEKIYDHVELMPMFPGGVSALLQWVAAHIQYPQICKDNNIQGRVVVRFVVKKDGSIGKVKVVRTKDPDLDKEAIRVTKSLPRFTPGKQNGVSVDVWYTLPITFKLQHE